MGGGQAPPELDPLISRHLSPLQAKTRSREEGLEGTSEGVKKAKLRDLNPVLLQQDEITTQISVTTKGNKSEDSGCHNEGEGTSQLIKATSLGLSDRLEHHFPMNHNSLKADSLSLTLGLDEKFRSHLETSNDVASENQKGSNEPCKLSNDVMETNSNTTDFAARAVDLNEPLYQYRILGQVRSTEASECGSITSSAENNETMRRWNDMKQNGFAYNFQGKAPIPKPWRCQQTKKNDEELKKKTNMTEQGQTNMCSRIPASSHLLCGLNPGIIKHVRNSKQVNSILKAMLQNEKLEKQKVHREQVGQLRRSKEDINLCKEQQNSSAVENLDLALNKPSCSHFGYREQVGYLDFSTKRVDINNLSFKAANVAYQWLEFMQHDIELRLAKLSRSKVRVKNVIRVVFPCLLSRDYPPNKENEAPFAHSILVGCSNKAITDMHMARWKSLFNQMDLSLSEDGKHLEKWLGQVKELKFQCAMGLGYVSADGLSLLDYNLRVLNSREAWERECKVRAAAASIYSTSNMIMTSENVLFFQG